MTCAVHKDVQATGYCCNCGKPLCAQCTRSVAGSLYCEPCLAATLAQSSYQEPNRRPWVAFGLGWIPGLGAVYNAEYMRAIVHVAIFVGLVTLNARGAGQPLWGLVTAAFICYMPIEAYITARHGLQRRTTSERVVATTMQPVERAVPNSSDVPGSHTPVGAIVLIALGGLFLLDNFGMLHFDRVIDAGWPTLLIGIGIWMLWRRSVRNS